MGRPKGSTGMYIRRSVEEKYEIIKLVLEGEYSISQVSKSTGINIGLISTWVKKYTEGGKEALEDTRKPGNPLARYQSKKELTPLEALEYENMKLKIENARLKKGYTNEEADRAKRKSSSKKNTK